MSTARASRCSSAAGASDTGRRAAQGDPGRGDARRRRLARHAGEGGALHDPCCGSGTIAIEAAQIAAGHRPRRAAPLRLRAAAAVRQRRAARRAAAPEAKPRQARVRAPQVPIFASDVSFRMVDFARRNAERAGVADCDPASTAAMRWSVRRRALPAELPGTLMLNPPYGERIEVAGKAGRWPARRRPAPEAATRARPAGDARLGRATGRRRATSSPASRRTGRTLTPPSGRLDRVDPQPRHEACRARCGSRSRAACRSGTGRSSAGCSASTWSPARRAARRGRSRLERPRPQAARRCAAYQSQRHADQHQRHDRAEVEPAPSPGS